MEEVKSYTDPKRCIASYFPLSPNKIRPIKRRIIICFIKSDQEGVGEGRRNEGIMMDSLPKNCVFIENEMVV